MLNKNLLMGAIVSIAFTAPAFAGGGLVVNATNDAWNSVAVGGDAYHSGDSGFSDSYGDGPAIAGSIVMPAYFDCDCLEELNLHNYSTKAVAVGNAIAGSIVLQGH